MYRFLLTALLALSFSISAQTLDRAAIAPSASDVTPLLNGMKIPDVTLKTADGAPVSLRAQVLEKPAVLLFYRGGWCPYCNRQLAGLKDIEADLVEGGFQVLAISPESPARLQEQKLETEFAVTLLSDESLQTIREFGIGFYVKDDTAKLYKDKMNVDLTKEAESKKSVLPAPAVFIVDTKGNIVFNYVNPDYSVRLSPELLLQAAKLSL